MASVTTSSAKPSKTMAGPTTSVGTFDESHIGQKRSSSSIHNLPPFQSASHKSQASMSMSSHRINTHNHRDSSFSLTASGSPSSFHGGHTTHQQTSPFEGSSIATYPGSSSSADTTNSLIASTVQRLVKRLPFNSGVKLSFLEEDELVRTCVASLVTLSQFQLSAVLKELVGAIESLNRVSEIVEEISA